MPCGLFFFNSISNSRGVWLFLLLPWFIKNPEFNANSAEPDQLPRSAAFDLGIHCLPMSLFMGRYAEKD